LKQFRTRVYFEIMKLNKKIIEFLIDLEFNNNREWFLANKPRYEKDVKEPFLNLIEELRLQLLPSEPDLADIDAKKMVFRLHRDTRFSKDKTPYKTHLSALISPLGTKDKSYPSNYLQISSKEIMIAGGIYWFEEKELLQKVRNYIKDNNSEFTKLISDSIFIEKYSEIKGDKNKRLPKEFIEFEKIQPLIANKQFFWSASFEPKILFKDSGIDLLLSHFHAAKNLQDFLKAAIAS
jgi:uncharacterized protein (TIGR02453 family)